MKRSHKIRIGVELIFLLAALAFIFAGMPIYAALWHLSHGSTVKCGEFTAVVPRG